VALNWLAVSSGTAQGEAGKGSVLLEVAVPSLLFFIAISEEAPGGCDRLDGPAQAFGDDRGDRRTRQGVGEAPPRHGYRRIPNLTETAAVGADAGGGDRVDPPVPDALPAHRRARRRPRCAGATRGTRRTGARILTAAIFGQSLPPLNTLGVLHQRRPRADLGIPQAGRKVDGGLPNSCRKARAKLAGSA
jgi:hypothetical protein